MSKALPRIAISMGDPNGIGPEVILKTFSDPRILESCTPIIFGSIEVLNYYKKGLNLSQLHLNKVKDASGAQAKKLNLVQLNSGDFQTSPGKSEVAGGKLSFESLKAACLAIKEGHADLILTAPINKENIQSEDFKFPGHTEFLAEEFNSDQVVMMLCGHHSKVALVTGHVPVSEISKHVSQEKIGQILKVVNRSLKLDFNIRKPKIAVLGLNPHAGDGGLLGKEEKEIIEPAIAEAHTNDILAFGPYAADGFWANNKAKHFDLVLAMYHDQGLVPFKASEFSSGVNFTAGLNIVRCSPDHGTAYDIAGKAMASADSFREALFMGIDVYKRRSENIELEKAKSLP